MNKILLATTALVATAGFAAAEVSLSGSAEMGIADLGGANGVEFHHDLDVKFTLSGETDGGLTFGATIDLDELDSQDSAGDIGSKSGAHSVFISGGFGTLTLGDTDGALDWAMQEVGIGSALADDHTTHAGFNFNSGNDGTLDGQVLRYDNTFGDFSVAVSAELNDGGNIAVGDDIADKGILAVAADVTAADAGSDTFGLGFKYNAALGGLDLGLGLGYQTGSAVGSDGVAVSVMDRDIIGLSVDTTFANGLRAILNYSDISADDSTTGAALAAFSGDHVGLGLGYTSGALTVSANYGEFSYDDNSSKDGFGVAVNYDLGGAAVQFGYGDGTTTTAAGVKTSSDTWSLGLAMSF